MKKHLAAVFDSNNGGWKTILKSSVWTVRHTCCMNIQLFQTATEMYKPSNLQNDIRWKVILNPAHQSSRLLCVCLDSFAGVETLTASTLHTLAHVCSECVVVWCGLAYRRDNAQSQTWGPSKPPIMISCLLLSSTCYYYRWTYSRLAGCQMHAGLLRPMGKGLTEACECTCANVGRNLQFTRWVRVSTSFPSDAAAVEVLKWWIINSATFNTLHQLQAWL